MYTYNIRYSIEKTLYYYNTYNYVPINLCDEFINIKLCTIYVITLLYCLVVYSSRIIDYIIYNFIHLLYNK